MEVNPRILLDTKMPHVKCMIHTSVVRKEMKILNPWPLAILKTYKRNVMLGKVLRAKRIPVTNSSNLKFELTHIMKKYLNVDFPSNFLESLLNSEKQNEDFTIPNWLFQENDESKFFIQLPYCAENEQHFLDLQTN